MNNVNNNNSPARRTIGGHTSASKRLASVKAKLATLGALQTKLFALCANIERLSTELHEIADSESEANHYLGEESLHLVQQAENLREAHRQYDRALRFVKDCVSLRSNDSRMNTVYHRGSFPPVDYGSLISDCLRHNTRVTEIGLYLDTMFERDYDVETIQRKLRALLRYIGRSTALRKMNVYCSNNTGVVSTREMTVASLLLDAIRQNQCIDELHWCAYIPSVSFGNLMLKTTSLKTLGILCGHWQRYSRTEKSMMLESLSKNRSVVHLDLHTDWRMTESVLRTLSRGPPNPPLQHLSLGGTGRADQLHQLVPFLQSTTTLKHLELRSCDILVGHMNVLAQGLKAHYDRPTASITRLSLTSCSFDDDAAAAFIQFMQTPVSSSDCETRPFDSNLQELHMDVLCDDDGEDVTEFGGIPLGSAMVLLVTTVAATNPVQPAVSHRASDRQDTIGSQLRLLSVDPLPSMEGFCNEIKAQAMNIKLPSLSLAPFRNRECWELATWLPYLLSLTELHLSDVYREVDPCGIIMALQQSQSLRSVTVMDVDGRRYLNDSNTRRIECICQRNQALFELLSRPTHVKWNNNNIVVRDSNYSQQQQQRRRKKRKTTPRDSSDEMYCDTETLLLPSLIQAAKYMPYTRTSTILGAVLVLDMEFSG